MAKKPESALPLQAGPEDQLDDFAWLTADVEKMMLEMSPDERKSYVADVERIRKQDRRPFGSFVQKLELPKRVGYDTHWFNDVPGRVDTAIANGWAPRKDKDGQPLRRVVGTGRDSGPLYAYAMDIPWVFRQEDLDRRHQEAQDRMDDIKKNPIRAKQGQAKAADRGKFYSPKEEGVLSSRESLVRTAPPAS